MTFYPDGRSDNATIVATADGKSPVKGADYRSELEAYFLERELTRLMTQRTGVCG